MPARGGAPVKMKITNHQFPITKQYPNTNHQSPISNNQRITNHQYPITKCLIIGYWYWNLFGYCILVIGYYCRQAGILVIGYFVLKYYK